MLLAAAVLVLSGCVTGGQESPPEVCLAIEASENLNLFDGEPHVVVAFFYPLQNEMSFQQTDAADLLDGKRPAGMTGDRWETTIYPGTTRELRETLPRDTEFVGVLADFYAGPSRTVVPAECGTFSQGTVVLSASDVQTR
jgi:type VI secretion system VasD/TssJ family lipoprotein